MKGSSISNGSRCGSNSASSSDGGVEDSDEDDDSRAGRGPCAPAAMANLASAYRGVGHDGKYWRVRFYIGGTDVHAGSFEKEEDAARAHDVKALELFARPILNFEPVSGQRNKECKLGNIWGRYLLPCNSSGREPPARPITAA